MSLQKIQKSLNAPKGQTNKFGGYKYRSCEDILTAVKPLLDECGYSLVISDDIKEVGGRVYVRAECTIFDEKEGKIVANNSAWAREAQTKKGMDESQITGAASSYARKYALNGLFLIDDTKDADSNEQAKDLRQPRVPHDEQLKLELAAMDKQTDISLLKTMARTATDYFNDWGQEDAATQIKAKYTEVAGMINSEKQAAA